VSINNLLRSVYEKVLFVLLCQKRVEDAQVSLAPPLRSISRQATGDNLGR
jgi:hypothetical protein